MHLLLILSMLWLPVPVTQSKIDGSTDSHTLIQLEEASNDMVNFEDIYVNRNLTKGCACRMYGKNLSTCFGNSSCEKFPKITLTSTNFKLHDTIITVLQKHDFKGIRDVEKLAIERNTFLTVIESRIFINMSKLRNLSISFNSNLKMLQNDTFVGLKNLRELFLVRNGFESVVDLIPALATKFLQNIFKLSLNENDFFEIGKDDFRPMLNSTLRELNLILCRIKYMDSESLTPLIHLAAIRLGGNHLNSTTLVELITNSSKYKVPLKFLNLSALGFQKSPPKPIMKAISRSTISQLCLSGNQFQIITNNTFPLMPSIKYLDLRNANVVDIKPDAFKSLPNLRTLLLNRNNLNCVPGGTLFRELTYLDLSLNCKNLASPRHFSLGKNKFVKMKKLKYLNLSNNRIDTLHNFSFSGLSKLRVLELKKSSIRSIVQFSFSPLLNLLVLNLENNNFVLRRHIFSGLVNLRVLLLGGCSISTITVEENPFRNMSVLSYLCLKNNYLTTLSPEILHPLPNLITFDISKNYFSTWENPIFTNNKNLAVMIASYNKFSQLTAGMLSDFENLTHLIISKNPFICDCSHFQHLNIWIKVHQKSNLTNIINAHPVYCAYPYQFRNSTLLKVFYTLKIGTTSCVIENYELYALLLLPSVVFIVIASISCALIYFFRWNIQYWLLVARTRIVSVGIIPKNSNCKSFTNCKYDALVSYSSEDKNFTVRLVAMLENFEPFLKLCVAERDFEVGSLISENFLCKLEQSRNTVLIISDSYARSEWCRWKVQIIQRHRLNFEGVIQDLDESLVIIKLGNVNTSSLTPVLKYLIKTRINLEWYPNELKQTYFWKKLRNMLSPSTIIYDNSD